MSEYREFTGKLPFMYDSEDSAFYYDEVNKLKLEKNWSVLSNSKCTKKRTRIKFRRCKICKQRKSIASYDSSLTCKECRKSVYIEVPDYLKNLM